MRHTHWLGILTVTSLLVLFQNCAQVGPSASVDLPKGNSSEKVIGDASQFNSIIFDEQLEMPAQYQQQKVGAERLVIDLQSGNMSLGENTATPKSCGVDNQRLNELRSIVQSASICEPIKTEDAVCMAIGMADIQLSNKEKTVELRPVICSNGTYLCDGLDQVFRDILKDLRANPPAGCQ